MRGYSVDRAPILRAMQSLPRIMLGSTLLIGLAAAAGAPLRAAAVTDVPAYDVVLRGGRVIDPETQLDGIRDVAMDVFGFPVRVAKPEKLTGMADVLRNPSYSTSVGLLRMGLQMDSAAPLLPNGAEDGAGGGRLGGWIAGFFRRLLPDDEA